jgi:hypothetical protein
MKPPVDWDRVCPILDPKLTKFEGRLTTLERRIEKQGTEMNAELARLRSVVDGVSTRASGEGLDAQRELMQDMRRTTTEIGEVQRKVERHLSEVKGEHDARTVSVRDDLCRRLEAVDAPARALADVMGKVDALKGIVGEQRQCRGLTPTEMTRLRAAMGELDAIVAMAQSSWSREREEWLRVAASRGHEPSAQELVRLKPKVG